MLDKDKYFIELNNCNIVNKLGCINSGINIELFCKDCGAKPAIDKEKSNENWTVYKSKCDRCGGIVVPKLT